MDFSETIAAWAGRLAEFVGTAYSHAPVLVLAMSLFLVFPILIFVGWWMRPNKSKDEISTKLMRSTKFAGSATRDLTGRSVIQAVPPLPSAARVEISRDAGREDVEAAEQIPFEGREMLRLGREDDNDVCIDEATVHRYHAIIKRSLEAGYVISDISTDGGNGVFVNGKRTREATLEDGDEINLGAARLVFRSEERPAVILDN